MGNSLSYEILHGDCLTTLKTIPDRSVRVCVTSPPYFGLRDYGTAEWTGGDVNCNHKKSKKSNVCIHCGATFVDKQIGLEQTPDEYIDKLVKVFLEVQRVLTDDGTVWLNIGDSYSTKDYTSPTYGTIKKKDMVGIPWMLAFALRKTGWYIRQDIIFEKSNPIPESVTDRCTKSHEYLFLLSKQPKYHFNVDAILEDATCTSDGGKFGGSKYGNNADEHYNIYSGNVYKSNGKRHKRDVWRMSGIGYSAAHFATFPVKLVEPCILAGSDAGDTVLDPFNGSGTTGVVALQNGRKYIGCELNSEYIKLTEVRFNKTFSADVDEQADNSAGEEFDLFN